MSNRDILYAAAGASGPANYIEDVFSTYLYTGNGSSQTITNNIDLSGKGGLVWIKGRGYAGWHNFTDTERGPTKNLFSNSTIAQATATAGNDFASFNSNGFSLGTPGITNTNDNAQTFVSWTFRKQAKFFDVVTGTGGGTFSHSLNVTPGMIIIKLTGTTSDWWLVHRGSNGYFRLNLTNAAASTGTPGIASSGAWVNANSTTFNTSNFVSSGETFVAYLFAHDAGGFGASGSDNVISCGSVNTTSAGSVNLGYEPQWLLLKGADASSNWFMVDNMRGLVSDVNSNSSFLFSNLSSAEVSTSGFAITSTGFSWAALGYTNLIYMAIRRGPMKTPTSGTEVFSPITSSATTGTVLTTGFPIDLQIAKYRNATDSNYVMDRLRGVNTNGVTGMSSPFLVTDSTSAEAASTNLNMTRYWINTSFQLPVAFDSASSIYWSFRRAPGFFDIVCYTGTGSARTVTHNLGVAPELMIVKSRSGATAWYVYAASLGATKAVFLNRGDAGSFTSSEYWNDTAPTSSVFTVGVNTGTNNSGATYVAYLFATLAGVSKVGSYTGTGSTQTISCGFTGGARFVLIKRTDSTGNWWVWDTARGMVASTDPRLALNSTDAETNANWVYTTTGGFQIVTSDATVNANGGSYIYLAVA